MNFYDDNHTFRVGRRNLKWTTKHPEEVGLKSGPLQDGENYLSMLPKNLPPMASFLVVKGDCLVWEKYFGNLDKDVANNVHSVSKTILSTLVGIALSKRHIESLETPIKEYLEPRFSVRNSRTSPIRIKDLLTLTSGILWNEDSTEHRIDDYQSWVQAILDRNLEYEPGENFNYSTGDTHLLAATLSEAIGRNLLVYAREHLFNYLEIDPVRWAEDPDRINCGGFNFYMTPRELARLARLFLLNGMWNGFEVVSQRWIEEAWKIRFDGDYGFLWYVLQISGHCVRKMWGFGGQFVYVLPDDDVAVILTTYTYNWANDCELDGDSFLETYIVPALPSV